MCNIIYWRSSIIGGIRSSRIMRMNLEGPQRDSKDLFGALWSVFEAAIWQDEPRFWSLQLLMYKY